MSAIWPGLAALLVMAACGQVEPDDREPADPVVHGVEFCEPYTIPRDCGAHGRGTLVYATVEVTDVDGDLNLPEVRIAVLDGEARIHPDVDLGSGGRVTVPLCRPFERGAEIPWRVSVGDASGRQSQPLTGSYQLPTEPSEAEYCVLYPSQSKVEIRLPVTE